MTAATITRPAPDRLALEHAHRMLRVKMTLDEMLAHDALRLVLENVARTLAKRRQRFDFKKAQANDYD